MQILPFNLTASEVSNLYGMGIMPPLPSNMHSMHQVPGLKFHVPSRRLQYSKRGKR
jgi:hypothetical protein